MNLMELMKAAQEILTNIESAGKIEDVDSVTIDTEEPHCPAKLFVDYKGGIRSIYNYDKDKQCFEYEDCMKFGW